MKIFLTGSLVRLALIIRVNQGVKIFIGQTDCRWISRDIKLQVNRMSEVRGLIQVRTNFILYTLQKERASLCHFPHICERMGQQKVRKAHNQILCYRKCMIDLSSYKIN